MASAEEQSNQAAVEKVREHAPWWLTFLVLTPTLIALTVYALSKERGAMYAALILGISLLFEVVILRVWRQDSKAFAVFLAGSELAKVLLLIAYCGICAADAESPWRYRSGLVLSVVAFFLACIVLALSFVITTKATEQPSSGRLRTLIAILQQSKTLSLACMLLAFLHMTYFLTFALAFHDKVEKQDTLRAAPADEGTPHGATLTPTQYSNLESTCENPDPTKIWRLYFLDKKFDLDYTKRLKQMVDQRSELAFCRAREQDSRVALFMSLEFQTDKPTREQELALQAAAWNVRELKELQQLFKIAYEKAPHRVHIVEIQAHASHTGLASDTFSSQTDVSRLRADHVRELLRQLCKDATENSENLLEFTSFAVGNTDSFWQTSITDVDPKGLDKYLSVEVRIRPKAGSAEELIRKSNVRGPLSLLDYLYFMIYTVTTTGYGDMSPRSVQAKFIVSVANLFELFFLVLIVNSIAAFPPKQEKQVTAPGKPAVGN